MEWPSVSHAAQVLALVVAAALSSLFSLKALRLSGNEVGELGLEALAGTLPGVASLERPPPTPNA